jgi:hypothetical protein
MFILSESDKDLFYSKEMGDIQVITLSFNVEQFDVLDENSENQLHSKNNLHAIPGNLSSRALRGDARSLSLRKLVAKNNFNDQTPLSKNTIKKPLNTIVLNNIEGMDCGTVSKTYKYISVAENTPISKTNENFLNSSPVSETPDIEPTNRKDNHKHPDLQISHVDLNKTPISLMNFRSNSPPPLQKALQNLIKHPPCTIDERLWDDINYNKTVSDEETKAHALHPNFFKIPKRKSVYFYPQDINNNQSSSKKRKLIDRKCAFCSVSLTMLWIDGKERPSLCIGCACKYNHGRSTFMVEEEIATCSRLLDYGGWKEEMYPDPLSLNALGRKRYFAAHLKCIDG